MELMRSLIFVPGNRENMLERARSFDADIIMVDLEDSVPPGEKVAARDMAREWVPTLRAEGKRVMVRVNSLDTGLTRAELEEVVSPDLHGISLGKVESVRDIRTVDSLLAPLEAAAGIEVGSLRIIPWIETAKAVWDARAIAEASRRAAAIAFGAEDLTNDMGIERTDTGEEVVVPRSLVPVAARAAEMGGLDAPFVRFRDPDALREDARRARRMGYTGKFAIHPAQLQIINETFSPSAEEIEYARRVVEAWDAAEAAGRGSLALDGRMVDVPVVKRAQNLLALAEAIGQAGS
jgi:citrate lyase subunit beta/citryl-CoA lyase